MSTSWKTPMVDSLMRIDAFAYRLTAFVSNRYFIDLHVSWRVDDQKSISVNYPQIKGCHRRQCNVAGTPFPILFNPFLIASQSNQLSSSSNNPPTPPTPPSYLNDYSNYFDFRRLFIRLQVISIGFCPLESGYSGSLRILSGFFQDSFRILLEFYQRNKSNSS